MFIRVIYIRMIRLIQIDFKGNLSAVCTLTSMSESHVTRNMKVSVSREVAWLGNKETWALRVMSDVNVMQWNVMKCNAMLLLVTGSDLEIIRWSEKKESD